jgi:TonB-dependent starch-binding outer membrane protein SusC
MYLFLTRKEEIHYKENRSGLLTKTNFMRRKFRRILSIMLVFCITAAFAQAQTVSGKVTTQAGEAVPFATIQVKGTQTITSADAQGNFSISAKNGDVLIITGATFAKKEVTVSGPLVEVIVTAQVSALNEIVVTGYAARSKRSSTGASNTVSVNDIKMQPIASFDQMLQGQAPGLLSLSNSGQPGAAASVVIRGRGNLTNNSNPLYILDGIEITAADFATLNQNDFESITILKDATEAAIYGSRGANGVIVVTTKKGKAGKLRFGYDVQYGWGRFPESKLVLMNSNEKLDYEIANGNPNGWSNAEIDSLRQIDVNWADVFFRTGLTKNHQISASGGSEKTRFYASLGYFDQTGIVVNTGIKKYNGRINLETGTNHLKLGFNLGVGYSQFSNTTEANQSIASPLNAIQWTLPYFTPYDKTGNYLQDPTPTGQPNALQELLEIQRDFPQWKSIATVTLEYKLPFVKGLTIRTNWGGDYTQNEWSIFTPRNTYTGSLAQGGQGSLQRRFDRNFRYTGTNTISYKTEINKDHDLAFSINHEIVNNNFRRFNFTGFGLTLPFRNEGAITAGTATNGFIPTLAGAGTDNALLSFFATANYGYRSKYYLNTTIRRDASSRFGANNRWATFYQVGAGWIMSDEAFISDIKFVSLLKLRASIGTVGNQVTNTDFDSRALLGRSSYAGVTGLSLIQPGNPELKWETRQSINTGVEFGLFENRVSGSVDYYNALTKNLYLNRNISATSGFTSQLYNSPEGKLRNAGIEAVLRGYPIRTKNFYWLIEGNFTYNKNRVVSLPEGQDSTVAVDGTITAVGFPANSNYLVRYAGVDPANGDPLYVSKDGKVTNVFSASDQVILGTTDAPYFGGINNTFSYKGFELNVAWVFVYGKELYNNDRLNVENPFYIASSLNRDLLREWRNPGDQTNIPRSDGAVYFLGATTHFLEDASFWRLRNVMLSYNLPQSILNKVNITGCRLFVQGQNLYTITKWRSYDPEINANFLAGAQYPAPRTITAGLSLGF